MKVRVSWYSCQPPIRETYIDVKVRAVGSARKVATERITARYPGSNRHYFNWKDNQILPNDDSPAHSGHTRLEHTLPPSDR